MLPYGRKAWVIGFCALSALGNGFVAGCGSRPRAPALLDQPIYQNNQEGFRFLVPENWKQVARSEIPPGPATKERLLVLYAGQNANRGATLEVSLVDLAPGADLAAYLAGPRSGAKSWKAVSPAEPIEGSRLPATRYQFTARLGKDEMAREVMAFRRGERVYLFTSVFGVGDTTAREQVRRAIGSVAWKE
jgi:hypothetical protein